MSSAQAASSAAGQGAETAAVTATSSANPKATSSLPAGSGKGKGDRQAKRSKTGNGGAEADGGQWDDTAKKQPQQPQQPQAAKPKQHKPKPTQKQAKAASAAAAAASTAGSASGGKQGSAVPASSGGSWPKKGNGKGKRRERKSKGKANSQKSKGEELAKPRLKVVVRRLPPNLPEEIFWKAVSPWAKIQGRSSREDKQNDTEGDENGGTSQAQLPGPSEQPKSPVSPNVESAYYVAGKLKNASRRGYPAETGAMLHTFTRAYMRFKDIASLISFHHGFDGHLFRDSKGSEYQAVVEFAPFDQLSTDLSRRRKADPLQGTIEGDSHYKTFLASLEEKANVNDDGQSRAERTDAQLLAHLSSNTASNPQQTEKAKNTPLLEHLRAQRAAKMEALKSRGKKGQDAKGPLATKSQSKGKGKSKSDHASSGTLQAASTKATKKDKKKKFASMAQDTENKAIPADGAANRSQRDKDKDKKRAKKGTKEPPPSQEPIAILKREGSTPSQEAQKGRRSQSETKSSAPAPHSTPLSLASPEGAQAPRLSRSSRGRGKRAQRGRDVQSSSKPTLSGD